MSWIAWKMLIGDRSKYFGIIFGITFASLLIAQQSAIFCGLMLRTTSQIQDIQGADIWVMDKNIQYIDDIKPLSENDLYRVRGVEGVAWAVKLYKGLSRGRLANGNYQQIMLIGLDDATMVGAPRRQGNSQPSRVVPSGARYSILAGSPSRDSGAIRMGVVSGARAR